MCQLLPRLALALADGPCLNVPQLEVREMHSVLQQPVSHQGCQRMAHSFPQGPSYSPRVPSSWAQGQSCVTSRVCCRAGLVHTHKEKTWLAFGQHLKTMMQTPFWGDFVTWKQQWKHSAGL